jgi:hypothetical protein
MRNASQALHALAILASALCTAVLAADAPPATDSSALIAPPQGSVDINMYGHLATSIEAALDHCAHGHTAATPTPVDPPAVASTPIKTISMADGGRYYPMSLMAYGDQALGLVSFQIDALGNPRFTHVVKAVPANPRSEFHKAIRDIVRDSKFSPATIGGQPVASWTYVKMKFLLSSQGPMGNILSESSLREILAKARHGDVTSMAVAQYLNALEPSEVKLTVEESRIFLVHAALAGFREARGQLLRRLDPPACRQDPEVQEVYHAMSWRSGSTLALGEATRLMALKDPSTYHDIATLLHGAANATDSFTQVWATGLLATAPIAEIRDPAFALQVALTFASPEEDPDFTEVLAAAYAANGRFDDAVRSETLALDQARKRHWNDAQLRRRLTAYQSGKPWADYLCDCDGRLPW